MLFWLHFLLTMLQIIDLNDDNALSKVLNFGSYWCIDPCSVRYVSRCTDGMLGVYR